jgi:hypothetical protein
MRHLFLILQTGCTREVVPDLGDDVAGDAWGIGPGERMIKAGTP